MGRGGVTRTKHPLADPDNKRALFAELAAKSLEMIAPSFAATSLISLLHRLISVFRPTDKTDTKFVLGMLREHTGFINCKDAETWQFAYSAIADYFAARAFVESVGKPNLRMSLRLREARWQRTWLVACGVTHDATELMKSMIRAEGLSNAAKTTLLVKGLGEAKMIEPALYQECIQLVVDCLEKEMRRMRLDRAESKRGEDGVKTVRVFRMTQEDPWDAAATGSLRAAIFYRRKSDSLRQLLDSLNASPVEAVRGFIELLKDDGEYSETSSISAVRCVVSKRLSRDAPANSGE